MCFSSAIAKIRGNPSQINIYTY